MEKPVTKYNIGDQLWLAKIKANKHKVVCQTCCGQKYVTIILGDGIERTIDCETCFGNYNMEPTGEVEITEGWIVTAEPFIPDGVDIRSAVKKVGKAKTREHVITYWQDGYGVKEEVLFRTEKEAVDKSIERLENDKAILQEKELNKKAKKSWSYIRSAIYYRDEADRALRTAKRYRAKMHRMNSLIPGKRNYDE